MDLNKVVATMTDFSKTSGKDTYEARLDKATIDKDESDSEVVNFSKIAKDYSALKYKKVKVLFKKADEVYGIFATTDNTQKDRLSVRSEDGRQQGKAGRHQVRSG